MSIPWALFPGLPANSFFGCQFCSTPTGTPAGTQRWGRGVSVSCLMQDLLMFYLAKTCDGGTIELEVWLFLSPGHLGGQVTWLFEFCSPDHRVSRWCKYLHYETPSLLASLWKAQHLRRLYILWEPVYCSHKSHIRTGRKAKPLF